MSNSITQAELNEFMKKIILNSAREAVNEIKDKYNIFSPSPVTAGNAQAQTTAIEISAPFLPGTVLKLGCKGATFNALRTRLELLYSEGFISVNPSATIQIPETLGVTTWASLKSYIDQGVSYKDKSSLPSSAGKLKNGDYVVDKVIWESLGFTIMEHLEDMFKIDSNSGGTTINVKLNKDTITIEYRLSIYIERHELVLPRVSTRTRRRYLDPSAKYTYYDEYIRKAIEGVYHWKNEAPEIQGVKPTIKIKIYDKNENSFSPKWASKGILDTSSLEGYDFVADSKDQATIYVEESYPEGGIIGSLANMVPDAFTGWEKSKKLQIHIRNRGYGPKDRSLINGEFDRVIEHEFGHVLGLFDVYGYGQHTRPIEFLGDMFAPEADIDEIHITHLSPMFCSWNINDRPWERTETDLEMILFAWQENKLQCYIHSSMGEKSQAYFY